MRWPILSVVTFLPLLGAFLIALLRGKDAAVTRNIRWIALWTTLVTLATSLILVGRFDGSIDPDSREVADWKWIGMDALRLNLGADPSSYSPWLRPALEALRLDDQ